MPLITSAHHSTDGKDCDTVGTGKAHLDQTVGGGMR